MTTLKGNDLPLKPGHEDIPGNDINGDDETVLRNEHCNDCDTTLDDKKKYESSSNKTPATGNTKHRRFG